MTRAEEMREALAEISAIRDEVRRLVAAELREESLFTIKWEMISKLITTAIRSDSVREMGNVLEMLVEETPGTIRYAEKDAQKFPEADMAPIVEKLAEILATSKAALGDEVYRDIAMDWRSPR